MSNESENLSIQVEQATTNVLSSLSPSAKIELAELLQKKADKKRWRENPVSYFYERLGIRPETIDWSLLPEYAEHKYDGTPNPLKAIVDAVANFDWVACESAVGTGKCYGLGTQILMYDGSVKNVEDIIVGDKLMGDDSKKRNVLSLGRGREELFEITTTNKDSFIVNKSHILSLVGNVRKTKNKIVNLSVEEYLKRPKCFRDNHKLYRVPVDFPAKKLSVEPYFLGLWIGDGDKTNPRITTKDIEVIEYLNQYAKRLNLQVSEYRYPDRCPSYAITSGRTGGTHNKFTLKNELEKIGVIGKRKHIPHSYKINSRTNRLELLAGLIDSDGYTDRTNFAITICEKELANEIMFLARSLGFRSNVVEKKATIKYINFSTIAYKISIIGNCSIIPTRIKRKQVGKRLINKNPLRTGFALKSLGIDNYYGFTLDGNHLHLLSNFIVVHNTHLASALALWFLECFENSLIVTTAPKADQLKLHIWKEIGKKYKKFNLGELSSLKLRMIPEQDEWIIVGFVAGIKADEDSTTKAQGFHAETMLIILEETPGIPWETVTALVNTAIAPKNVIVALGNPDSEQDTLSRFKKKSRVKHIRISGYDHPNVVLKNPSFVAGATTEQGLKQLQEDYPGDTHPMYLSRAKGISPTTNIDALISRELLNIATKSIFEDGVKALGVDVANSLNGDDASICEGAGQNCKKVTSFKNKNANELGRRIQAIIERDTIEPENVGIDGIGVGSGTVNTLWDAGLQVTNILSGASAEEVPGEQTAEKFLNLRAQMWWKFRKDLEKNISPKPEEKQKGISLPLDEDLFEEVLQVRWGIHNGKIFIESKQDIKKRLGRSTDKADSVVYWNWVREKSSTFKILFGA